MSGPDIRVIPARPEHLRTIARRMRKADRDEVFAASGKSPREALAYSMRRSAAAWTGLIDGKPEVMFGVADLNVLTQTGAPWLLGTDAVEEHYVAFARRSIRFRDQLLARYAVLRNFVDVRNETSIRWLEWLGSSFSEPVEIRGHAFLLFELRAR